MATDPAQRRNQPDRTPRRDDAGPDGDRKAAPKSPAEKSSDRERKQQCDALGERFPEQCDTPIADDAPAEAMPDEKKADSRPQQGQGKQ